MDVLKIFATADNVTATLVAGTILFAAVRAMMRRTVLRRLEVRRGLESVGLMVNDEFVRGVFGSPVYGALDPSGSGTLIWDVEVGYLAILFSGNSARIIEFTLLDTRLRFDVRAFTQGIAGGRLGRSTYAQMMEADSGVLRIGARRMSYVEKAYRGNPGGYCTAYVGFSDAGAGTIDVDVSSFVAGELAWSRDGEESEREFVSAVRRNSKPNVVAIAETGAPKFVQLLADLDMLRLRGVRRQRISLVHAVLRRAGLGGTPS